MDQLPLYTLTLPKPLMDVIILALRELPYKHAAPVIDEALKQWTQQEANAQVLATPPPAP